MKRRIPQADENREETLPRLKEGDVFTLDKTMSFHHVVPLHFVSNGELGNFKDTTRAVINTVNFFDYLEGQYVVTATSMQGGGQGHGPNDVYPAGLYINAVSKCGKFEIGFFQSRSHTPNNYNVPVVGRAKRVYVIE